MVKITITMDKRRLQRLVKKLEAAEETLQADAVSSMFDKECKEQARRGADGVSTVVALLQQAAKPLSKDPTKRQSVGSGLVGKTIKAARLTKVDGPYGKEPATTLHFTDGTKHTFVHPET
jgi:hypothetical protein